MRDVWVAFIDHPAPDEQIVSLRQQMSRQASMMYESIADTRNLKEKLTERLESWETVAGSKVPRHVDLLPSSGKDVLRAANLRLRGEKLVDLGQAEAGRDALKEAAVLGGPVEQLAYARFQAWHGDLKGAYDSTQQAIEHFASGASHLYSPLAAEALAAQARVLRRQGRDVDAIGRLEQALTLLDEHDAYAQKVRCRILDDLYHRRRRQDRLGTHMAGAGGGSPRSWLVVLGCGVIRVRGSPRCSRTRRRSARPMARWPGGEAVAVDLRG